MSVATQTLAGHRIVQKPIADVILKSLEQAQWNGRGFKNLHADITVARGKAHGSAIHQALRSLRKAELIVMHGQPGSRRTTYYLPRYAPDAKAAPLTTKRGPAAAVSETVEIFSQAAARIAAQDTEPTPPATDRLILTVNVDEFLRPEPGTVRETPAPVVPSEVQDLADRIAAQVRETVIALIGDTLAQAHADAAAAQELAEDAERRYNELKGKLAALV